MKKKIIFIVFSLIISSCNTTSQEIDQLEEQIVALENKENLTSEEEAELNQLIEKQEELIEDDPVIEWDISKLRKEIFRKKLAHVNPSSLRNKIVEEAFNIFIKKFVFSFFELFQWNSSKKSKI